ncbi:hypothetical protein [Paractinoplanes lichenicola]|uniref:Camelysin metallo-endopeptidase n=1 Tax=Paractinoplanes lichenicola TaxID=2802976 RepID=A0ABS1VWR3_9ACTN|nr:hypothetical protein [Actinoplanes lichenicola]MBL7258868.1 hypothetical protein [Actinoplanes lichenicola]
MRRRLALVAGAALAVAVVIAGTASAAFTSDTANGSNAYTTGTVEITDNDSGSALFSTAADGPLRIGQTFVQCVAVTYTGSLPAAVRLYASATTDTRDPSNPTGLGPRDYLRVQVEEGTGATSFGSCAGFSATGVLWNGYLTAFPSSYAAGPATGGTRSYRFTMALDDATPDAAEGGTATATFTWEARNT